MNKKLFLFLVLSVFLIGIISAQVSYCCEMTNEGDWCQNAPQEDCDEAYRSVPTSCEATSYCRMGTCIDTEEGNCMPNTAESTCTDEGGVWDEREKTDIPQCQLGCCLIGEQAAFSTLTRCKSLASIYGLEINYRADVQNEMECIALAGPNVKGACVFEEEYQRNCKFSTKQECQEMSVGNASTSFHEGYLCSNSDLDTICGSSKKTTCVDGRDEVYFMDTCGNLANVYDSSRVNDPLYWNTILAPTCGDEDGNVNSPTCGNCDYFEGSTCKRAERGKSPRYGENVCKDLSCEYEGEHYEHGETWCGRVVNGKLVSGSNPGVTGNDFADLNTNGNNPGNRDVRLICYNNEVMIEPCAEFRQEVCIESEVNEFSAAGCVVNKWQDCYAQDNKKDCENIDQRDCVWMEGVSILKDDEGLNKVVNTDDELVSVNSGENLKSERGEPVEASCVPRYTPGFNFWEENEEIENSCSLASTACYVEYVSTIGEQGIEALAGKKGFPADAKALEECKNEKCVGLDLDACLNLFCPAKDYPSQCVNNDKEYSIKDEWLEKMNNLCNAMGDCGSSVNYQGDKGYYDEEDFISRSGENED